MKFYFDQNRFSNFLSKWERGQYLLAIVLFLVALVCALSVLLDNNPIGLLIIFIVFCYIFSVLVIKWFILESKSINRFISLIEFENSSVKLSTASFSTLFGLMKKKSITLEFSKCDIQFELAKPKYPMNNKYLGTVYILKIAEKEFYLLENLYDDFENLKKELKNSVFS